MKHKHILWIFAYSGFILAGEPIEGSDIFYDASEDPAHQETLAQEEAAITARLAAEEHDQQLGTTNNGSTTGQRQSSDTPTNIADPADPVRTGPGNRVKNEGNVTPIVTVLPKGPSVQETSQKIMANNLSQVKNAFEDMQLNGTTKSFNNAWTAYKTQYTKNKNNLTLTLQARYEPIAVLNTLLKSADPVEKGAIQNALTTALAGPSLTIKIFGSDVTQADAMSSNLRNGIKMFVNAVNQIDALTRLLNEQALLMTEKTNANQLSLQAYTTYSQQWNIRYKQLQDAMQPGVNLNGRLRQFAADVHTMTFIDVGGDNVTLDSIRAQIDYVKQLDVIYDTYLTCFAKVGLKDPLAGTSQQLTFGLFGFVQDINVDQELQMQIVLAQLREQAQPFFKRLLSAIKNFIYPSAAAYKKWDILNEQLLGNDQQNLYNIIRLTDNNIPLTSDQISTAGRLEENFLANEALANYPAQTLGIDDFRNLLKFDEKTQSIDQLILHAFYSPVDMTEAERNTYTFVRGGARLLKAEYVQHFIKYRLLGMTDDNGNLTYIRRMNKLMADGNSLWTDFTDDKRSKLQVFINDNTYWDLNTNQFVLNLDADTLMSDDQKYNFLNTWLDLTEAIQAWTKKDVNRLNELMQQDYNQAFLSADDIDLLRYYLALEKVLSGNDAPVAQQGLVSIDDVVHLCFPLTNWAVRQALTVSSVNLVTFIKYAKNMNTFFNGKGGIKESYLSVQAAYVVNLNASMQQQVAGGNSQTVGAYTTLLAPSYQQYTGAILAVLNEPRVDNDDGGSGGHGGSHNSDLRLRLKAATKCYDEHGQEVHCIDKGSPVYQSGIDAGVDTKENKFNQ